MKYGETSLIIDIYTRDFGQRSYIVNGVRKSNSKNSAAILQATNFLDIIAYDKKEPDKLNRLKEYKLQKYHDGIYSHPLRSMISQFMIEVLRKCIKDYEANIELYDFIDSWFSHLNSTKNPLANCLLVFLVELAGLMGFGFSNEELSFSEYFDLQEGEFTSEIPEHRYFISGTLSNYLKLIIQADKADMHEFNIQNQVRSQLLDQLIIFYRLHVESFGELKTLEILRTVMR